MRYHLIFRDLSRAFVTIVLALTASLYLIAPLPAQALGITITPPISATLGNLHSFSMTISIPPSDLVPITSIDLEIYNTSDAGYKVTLPNLPLDNGLTASYDGSGGTLSITTSTSNLQRLYGTTTVSWGGRSLYFDPPTGYGYGNNSSQTASITYTGTWTSPVLWPAGGYIFKLSIVTSLTAFSQTAGPIAFFAPPPGTGESTIIIKPGVVDVTHVSDSQGVFYKNARIQSPDNKALLTINTDTTGRTRDGEGIKAISILVANESPPIPTQNSNISLVYQLEPEGATFSPPVTISFQYDPVKIPTGWDESKLKIAYFDKTVNKWVELDSTTVDTVTHVISAKISHFTPFTVLAYPPGTIKPASFTIGFLEIAPPQVSSGETVYISSVVTNTGEISGNYTVNLVINNVKETTKNLSLPGGTSQIVTFTSVKSDAGTYSVNVNGQSGNFTVKAAKGLLKPAHFTIDSLNISPPEVDSGKNVTISAIVTNTGNLSGKYQIILKINDTIEDAKDLTLTGGTSETVKFTTSKNNPGAYTVGLNSLSGSFIVREVSPPGPPTPPPEVRLAWLAWVLITLGAIGVITVLVRLARISKLKK